MIDAGQTMFFIFDADAPPDMRFGGSKSQAGREKMLQALGSFCEHLKSVPTGGGHNFRDSDDVFLGDLVVEEIAHRVDEDHFRCAPAERFGQFFWNETQVEPPLVRVAFYAAETFGEGFGVAVFAAWTDFGAAPNRVPGCVRPFDCRVGAHV